MRFKLKSAKTSKNPTDTLEVQLEFMHGDVNGDSTEIIARFHAKLDGEYLVVSKNERGSIEELLPLLERIESDFDRHDSDDPFSILVTYPGFENWFKFDTKYGGSDYWPGDNTCDGAYIASYEGYKLFYYDAFGARREVAKFD